jgi:hypothetical protein
MSAARDSRARATGGTSRLLDHCEAIGRMVTNPGPASARTRLENELGSELACRLVGALARRGGRVLVGV